MVPTSKFRTRATFLHKIVKNQKYRIEYLPSGLVHLPESYNKISQLCLQYSYLFFVPELQKKEEKYRRASLKVSRNCS